MSDFCVTKVKQEIISKGKVFMNFGELQSIPTVCSGHVFVIKYSMGIILKMLII
jgi:hypothetical protein